MTDSKHKNSLYKDSSKDYMEGDLKKLTEKYNTRKQDPHIDPILESRIFESQVKELEENLIQRVIEYNEKLELLKEIHKKELCLMHQEYKKKLKSAINKPKPESMIEPAK